MYSFRSIIEQHIHEQSKVSSKFKQHTKTCLWPPSQFHSLKQIETLECLGAKNTHTFFFATNSNYSTVRHFVVGAFCGLIYTSKPKHSERENTHNTRSDFFELTSFKVPSIATWMLNEICVFNSLLLFSTELVVFFSHFILTQIYSIQFQK